MPIHVDKNVYVGDKLTRQDAVETGTQTTRTVGTTTRSVTKTETKSESRREDESSTTIYTRSAAGNIDSETTTRDRVVREGSVKDGFKPSWISHTEVKRKWNELGGVTYEETATTTTYKDGKPTKTVSKHTANYDADGNLLSGDDTMTIGDRPAVHHVYDPKTKQWEKVSSSDEHSSRTTTGGAPARFIVDRTAPLTPVLSETFHIIGPRLNYSSNLVRTLEAGTCRSFVARRAMGNNFGVPGPYYERGNVRGYHTYVYLSTKGSYGGPGTYDVYNLEGGIELLDAANNTIAGVGTSYPAHWSLTTHPSGSGSVAFSNGNYSGSLTWTCNEMHLKRLVPVKS